MTDWYENIDIDQWHPEAVLEMAEIAAGWAKMHYVPSEETLAVEAINKELFGGSDT